MIRWRAWLALPLFLPVAASGPTFAYRIDAARSEVSARVPFMGLASKTAHFPVVSGGIALSPDRLDAVNLAVTLDARALSAGDRTTMERLKGKDFFDVAHHPVVTFTGRGMAMTGPVTARVEGDVTARGVTRPATLTVVFAQPPGRATGRDPLQLSARTVIDRRAFGMTAYSLVVGRKVTITINARMVPQ